MCNLHWCYTFCTSVTCFALVLHFLHWCYTWTALFSANQNREIFSCVLLPKFHDIYLIYFSWARRTLPSLTQFPYSVSNCTSSVRNMIRISHMMGPCNKFLIKATSVEVSLRSRELKLNLRCEQSRLRTWDTGPQPRDKNYNATQMVSKRGH